MKHINGYLTFNGNCREAMTFYQDCFGGELFLQSIGDSPVAEQMPTQMKAHIMHATLTIGNVVLMGSDMAPHTGLITGNNVSLLINCESEAEIKERYEKLLAGSIAHQPLGDSFWGAIFGHLTDKFGINWLLNYNKP